MSSIRSYIDPSGKLIAHRLAQLCVSLEGLGTRLRGTIASAVGETIGELVRDTAWRVLDEAFSSPAGTPSNNHLARERFSSGEPGYWDEYDQYAEVDQEDPPAPAPMPPQRLPTALSTGLQAASLWLQRWTGRSRTFTTVAVGLMATAIAFVGGPIVGVVVGLAGTATQFGSLSDVIGTGVSVFRGVSPA